MRLAVIRLGRDPTAITAVGRRATLLALDSLLPGLPGFGREDELFAWDSLPSPSRLIERLWRHSWLRVEQVEPDRVSC